MQMSVSSTCKWHGWSFIVPRARVIDVRQPVEGEFAVALEAFFGKFARCTARRVNFFCSGLYPASARMGSTSPRPPENLLENAV